MSHLLSDCFFNFITNSFCWSQNSKRTKKDFPSASTHAAVPTFKYMAFAAVRFEHQKMRSQQLDLFAE
jgi:hypothetical protein